MPGSVSVAAPSEVFPLSLSTAFLRSHEMPVIENSYKNGESQRYAYAASTRKRWRLSKRLALTELSTLRTFFDARDGQTEPFYFYDPHETSPLFSHDPTGVSLPGRYTVRFSGNFSQSISLQRADVQVELAEIA